MISKSGKRGCKYSDVTDVVALFASDYAMSMTDEALNATGGQEMR